MRSSRFDVILLTGWRFPYLQFMTMTHFPTLHQVYDLLGDIRRMVPDALQVARDQDESKRALDGPRICHHVREQDTKYLVPIRVHLSFLYQNLVGQGAIFSYERL